MWGRAREGRLREKNMTVGRIDEMSTFEVVDSVLERAFDYVRAERSCDGISDREFARYCVGRVFQPCQSGRDYIQFSAQCNGLTVPRATFFDALHSARRCEMTQQLGNAVYRNLQREIADRGVDYLANFPELDGLRVLAGDGHSISHACHAPRNQRGVYDPSSTIYLQDLRNGLCTQLGTVISGGRRRHEWPVFRSALPALDEGLGSDWKATVFVLDRAYIDNGFWSRQRTEKSPWHMITRFKKNMEPIMREPLLFDRDDEVNTGVVNAYMLGFNNNASNLYEVEYEDPESGTEYRFLTTLNPQTVRPGVIAWLYFLRWRIEKTFDTFKNDFNECKAWANGQEATRQHATYVAIAYNVTRFLLAELEASYGLEDEKVSRKFEKNLQVREERAQQAGRAVHPLHRTQRRMPKLSAQFLRAIRNHILTATTIAMLVPVFRAMLYAYL